jgi:hypothetical protein
MDELAASEVFERFVSPRLASSNVLYLGFSLDAAEHHLLGILRWISEKLRDSPEHYLLLNEAAVRSRSAEMEELEKLGFLTVVGYPPDPTHEIVERVALALAPRAQRPSGEESSSRETPTTLQPILVQARPEDDQERLAQKVFGFDQGWAGDEAHHNSGGDARRAPLASDWWARYGQDDVRWVALRAHRPALRSWELEGLRSRWRGCAGGGRRRAAAPDRR